MQQEPAASHQDVQGRTQRLRHLQEGLRMRRLWRPHHRAASQC